MVIRNKIANCSFFNLHLLAHGQARYRIDARNIDHNLSFLILVNNENGQFHRHPQYFNYRRHEVHVTN